MAKYKKYEKYKDSGVEWIGEIPEQWAVVAIKRLTRVKRGASPRPIDNPKYFDENGEFSWVRISDVTNSDMYLETSEQMLSSEGVNASVKIFPNELFISICATVGKPCISKIKCCIHDGFVYFPDFKGDNRYLYYIFDAGEAYKGLGKLGTQLNLNSDTVGSIYIPNINLENQKQIANFLYLKINEIDSLVADKEKLINLLEEKRQAIITEAVTRGLNPNVKMKNSGAGVGGFIPENWKLMKLKYLTNEKLMYGANESAELDNRELPRYIRITDIDGKGNLKEETFKSLPMEKAVAYLLKKGDVLLARSGATVGKSYIHQDDSIACFAGYLIRYRPNLRVLNPKFMYYFTKSTNYSDWIKESTIQATIQNVSAEKYANLYMPLPNIEEQNYIVHYLEKRDKEVDNFMVDVISQIPNLKEYRQSLILEAITGKIDVRDYYSEA